MEAAALKQVLSAAQGSAVQKTHTPILYVYVIIQPVETVLAPLSTTSAGLRSSCWQAKGHEETHVRKCTIQRFRDAAEPQEDFLG